jgi:hypothetical protein
MEDSTQRAQRNAEGREKTRRTQKKREDTEKREEDGG